MTAKLIVRDAHGKEYEFPLVASRVRIGRTSLRNDLVIEDLAVSREHALMRRSGDSWVLEDLNSANGTFVNGDFLQGVHVLGAGDVITIGQTRLTYEPEVPIAKSGEVHFEEGPREGTVMVSMVLEDMLSQVVSAAVPATPPEAPALEDKAPSGRFDDTFDEITKLRKKAKILALLYELGKTLSTVNSPEQIYKKASDMLFSLTPADRCVILLLDRESGELRPASVEVRDPRRDIPGGIVISRTITDRVLSEGVSVLVYDAQKDLGSVSVMIQAIRSVMCAPLGGQDRMLGVLYVDRRDMLSRFEDDDLDLLSAVAAQTAVAIENARSREQLQQEALVREKLGRFLPAGVVERVMAGEIKLGGVSQEVTTLFADIRGFTPLSERATPEVVVEILNEHFTIMTDAIVDYGGTLDKYIGDSVMALFGAPACHVEQDPINAVNAAIQMQQGMRLVNKKLTVRGLPNIKIGIGINTGRVIVGEIGSEKQMNYTAIGDAVNLAARLESNAKPGQILVSAETAALLRQSFALNPLPPLMVKGKSEPVPIFEVAWGGGV